MSHSKWKNNKNNVAHAGTPNDKVLLRFGLFLCPWCNNPGRKKKYDSLWKLYLHACTHAQKTSLLEGNE